MAERERPVGGRDPAGAQLGYPLLLAASHKIFLARLLGLGEHERGAATTAATAIGVLGGCRVIRVHDAKDARHAADLAAAVLRADRNR